MLSLCSIFHLFHDVCFAALLLVLSLKWKLMRLKSEKTKAQNQPPKHWINSYHSVALEGWLYICNDYV